MPAMMKYIGLHHGQFNSQSFSLQNSIFHEYEDRYKCDIAILETINKRCQYLHQFHTRVFLFRFDISNCMLQHLTFRVKCLETP